MMGEIHEQLEGFYPSLVVTLVGVGSLAQLWYHTSSEK